MTDSWPTNATTIAAATSRGQPALTAVFRVVDRKETHAATARASIAMLDDKTAARIKSPA
ncbi:MULTISPECIES: hypothetical protein [Bradyrhizobium]|uniref:hypothetical protein n=1 Tax=Bradyrhizobium TaxID=374 RepID=UPI0003FCCD66|nr:MULTISPECIES: hypothetical protein [Bradyrhizobium]KIU45916.1 hypothetical protein QU41_23965 [Bradyrhizobium elkanii]OCX27053.1 hypothetical protein QU42_30470 [Bradyrhizobium sp. UASWS1016]